MLSFHMSHLTSILYASATSFAVLYFHFKAHVVMDLKNSFSFSLSTFLSYLSHHFPGLSSINEGQNLLYHAVVLRTVDIDNHVSSAMLPHFCFLFNTNEYTVVSSFFAYSSPFHIFLLSPLETLGQLYGSFS